MLARYYKDPKSSLAGFRELSKRVGNLKSLDVGEPHLKQPIYEILP